MIHIVQQSMIIRPKMNLETAQLPIHETCSAAGQDDVRHSTSAEIRICIVVSLTKPSSKETAADSLDLVCSKPYRLSIGRAVFSETRTPGSSKAVGMSPPR